MDLSHLNGKKVAVLLCTAQQHRVLKGTARFGGEGTATNALRIELDTTGEDDGNPVLFIQGDEWGRTIVLGTEYGCDYQIGVCGNAKRCAIARRGFFNNGSAIIVRDCCRIWFEQL